MATQIDLGAVVPIGKGDWDIGTTYERTNIVRHNSAAWVCKVNTSIGVEPSEDSSDWYLLTKDTSSVTSVNGQKGDVTINIKTVKTPGKNDASNKIANTKWVNDKITPIESKLSSTTSTAESAKNTATLANNTANTALTNANNALSNLDNYLPITGGTVTGTLTVNDWFTVQTGVRNNNIRDELLMCSGSKWNDSSSLSLYSMSHHEFPGDFIIRAGKDSRHLKGTPDGQLIWSGQNIVRSINNIQADTNGNISLPLQYLPISGSYALNVSEGEFGVGTGTVWNDSSSITLYGNSRTDDNAGRFSIRAKSSSSPMKELIGMPSGQLVWAGQNIVRSVNGTNADTNGNVNLPPVAEAYKAHTVLGCIGGYGGPVTLPNYGTWAYVGTTNYRGWGSGSSDGSSFGGVAAGGTTINFDSRGTGYLIVRIS